MKEQPEPRSDIKPSSIWHSARVKTKKNIWNFRSSRERMALPELPTKIKPVSFGSKVYQWGPYQGTLEEIKDFARTKKIATLTNGAIKYKVG